MTIIPVTEIEQALRTDRSVQIGPITLVIRADARSSGALVVETVERGSARLVATNISEGLDRAVEIALAAPACQAWHQQAVIDGPVDQHLLPGAWCEGGPDAEHVALAYDEGNIVLERADLAPSERRHGVYLRILHYVDVPSTAPPFRLDAFTFRGDGTEYNYCVCGHDYGPLREVALRWLRRARAFLAQAGGSRG